jgi:NhaP-type Na+/H+ or K+/H+ antiporter
VSLSRLTRLARAILSSVVSFGGSVVRLFVRFCPGDTRLTESQVTNHFWAVWNWIANTLIFTIAGAIIAEAIFFENYINAEDWGTLFVVYTIQMLIRLVMCIVLWPVLYYSGKAYGYEFYFKDLILLWWSGLRGALALILALDFHQQDPQKMVDDYFTNCPNGTATDDANCAEDNHYFRIGDGSIDDAKAFQARLLFFVAGFALITLVINGISMRYVVSGLGLTNKTVANK